MEPMTMMAVAVGVQAVSGLIQAYQSEKSRGANSQRMKEIEALFNAIVPPEFDISLNDPPQLITQKMGDAQLDMSRITPEQFKMVGKYIPEVAPYVAEANPTLVERGAQGQQGIQAQMDALREYKRIAQGDDPAFQARLGMASDAAQGAAQSRQASILQDAQRRGMYGSGQSFASILQGASDSMMQGGQAGRDAAIASNQNRMNALGQSAALGGQIAGQDLNLQQSNADIINQFNQRTSKNYQQYLLNRQEVGNEAARFNLQNEQDIANRNVIAGNDADRFNLQNRNTLLQAGYDNRFNERTAQNQIAQSQANWQRDEKARLNELKQLGFNNQMGIASAKSGQGYQAMAMNNQATADRNAAIGGITSAISGGLGTAYANQREDERWDKYIKARQGG